MDLEPVDISPEAQIHAIEDTFKNAHDNFDITTLRHPTKPHLHAEESFELLPDADVWANQYMLFRFAERPGGRPVEVRTISLISKQMADSLIGRRPSTRGRYLPTSHGQRREYHRILSQRERRGRCRV